jgi:hypothetical protein
MWVNRVVSAAPLRFPVYPDQRKSSEPAGTSQRCHQETFRDLFDYLAGAGDADGRPHLRTGQSLGEPRAAD